MQMTFDWVKRPRVGRNSGGTGIVVSRNDYKAKNNGVVRMSTVVRISADVMKKARFVIGDRVMVGTAMVNSEKFLAIRRVPDGGYCISGPKANKGTTKNAHVKICTDALPLGNCELSDVEITEEGILLAPITKGIENGKS